MSGAPLGIYDGIPPVIEDVSLVCAADGSLSLYNMLWGRGLDQLRSLHVSMSPQSYDSPVASEVVRQVLRDGRLKTLETNCPLEQLTPLTEPVSALPTGLHLLDVHLPLGRGIPPVLEQLSNLRGLILINTEKGAMHLTRSLDPFLDMKHLECLVLRGKHAADRECAQKRFEWTPEALGFLALARTRLQKEAQMSGRKFVLFC